jgi:capsule polysaccharide modification protein KpsS
MTPTPAHSPEVTPPHWPAAFKGLLRRRRVLFLQGPMGDFFSELAGLLQSQGARTSKVHFNGGDQLFWRHPGALRYNGTPAAWGGWLHQLMREQRTDALVLFGQMRPIHRAARAVAQELGVEVFVFEEGYLRPDYVTVERRGVNALSRQPRVASYYRDIEPARTPSPLPTRQNIWRTARIAASYALASALLKPGYWRQCHHRSMNVVRESSCWARGGIRYLVNALRERHALAPLATPEQHKRWFLVPLQVHNDSQVKDHSRFRGMEHFLDEVVASFADHAPADSLLIIKHHPMDRAYTDYSAHIRRLAHGHRLQGRLRYLHDQHLPTLLQHARGVVTVNSTVALQALFHGTPVIALGDAIYQIPGMVFGGTLDAFWNDAGGFDRRLYACFRAHLIASTQLNASFYAERPALQGVPPRVPRPASVDEAGAQPLSGVGS